MQERTNMNSTLILSSVFAAGVLSFFSPCIFPLLPIYMGVLLNTNENYTFNIFNLKINLYSIIKTLAFVAGLSVVFITLGYGAGFLGKVLYSNWFRYAMGVVIIVLGVHQMELINIGKLQEQRTLQYKKQKGEILSSFILGLTFSFGWTPCVGPVLGSILGLAAAGGNGAVQGGFYMFVYTLGLAIPFLILALASSLVMNCFNKIKKHMGTLKKIGGFLIILMGVFVMFGNVSAITAFFENLF